MYEDITTDLPCECCDDSTIFGAAPEVVGVAYPPPSLKVLVGPENRTINTEKLYMKQNLPPGFLALGQVH